MYFEGQHVGHGFPKLRAESWEAVVLRKRGEGKFKSCMKALSEIKVNMKFKGKAAIPKGISRSVNYINKDSEGKGTYLLSPGNTVLQTDLSKH